VKYLLKLRTTLGNTSLFHSALNNAPKKLLALKSFLMNLGNAALTNNRHQATAAAIYTGLSRGHHQALAATANTKL